MRKEYFKKLTSKSAMSYLWRWAGKFKGSILILCGFRMVSVLLALALPVLTKSLVDAAIEVHSDGIKTTAIILCAVLVMSIGLRFVEQRFHTRVQLRMTNQMRSDFMDQLFHKKYVDLKGYHSGQLVNHLFNDIQSVVSGVMEVFPILFSTFLQLCGAVFLVAQFDLAFVAVLVGAGLFALAIMLWSHEKHKNFQKNIRESDDKIHATAQESIENIRMIKAAGIEERKNRELSLSLESYLKHSVEKNDYTSSVHVMLNMIFRGSWFYAMIWGCFGIYHQRITYGTLAAILQLVGQIQQPIAGLSGLMAKVYAMIVSAERLETICELTDEYEGDCEEANQSIYDSLLSIDLENLEFSYDRKGDIFSNVSLSIPKGSFVAVVGPSGIGKSTLFLLLLGIYTPTKGAITLKTVDGRILPGKKTRSLFAYVPQGHALFSGTIRDNVTMFCEEASEEAIEHALEAACIREFIDTLPEGLDTVIGERGLGLSEGQAQRIAVARALLKDAPILLLDEATSALDEATEAKMLEHIHAITNKTCFIVTHRKAAVEHCQYRLVIGDGQAKLCENHF